MIEVQCQPMSVSEVGSWGTISVQFSRSVMSDSVTPWTTAHQASLSIANSQSLLKLISDDEVSDAIQPSYPLLSLSPPALNLSQNQDLFK